MNVELSGDTKAIGSVWFSVRRTRRHPTKRWGGWPIQRAWANETEPPFRTGRGIGIRITFWHTLSVGTWKPSPSEHPWYDKPTPIYDDLDDEETVVYFQPIVKKRTRPWTNVKVDA